MVGAPLAGANVARVICAIESNAYGQKSDGPEASWGDLPGRNGWEDHQFADRKGIC
jgi:hypothetical protein